MRHTILFLLLPLLISKWSAAQCDQKVTWQSVKQEMINQKGEAEETKTTVVVIETTKESITITPEGSDHPFTATIKEIICEWKEMYTKGRTTYKIEFTAPTGRSGNGMITIEGKDGKLYLYLELPKFEGKKIRMEINKYEVKE